MTTKTDNEKYNVVRYYAIGSTDIIYSGGKNDCIYFMDFMEHKLKTSKIFRLRNTDSNGQLFIHKIEKAD